MINIDKKIIITEPTTKYELLHANVLESYNKILKQIKSCLDFQKIPIINALEKSFTLENIASCLSKYDYYDVKTMLPIDDFFSLSKSNESTLIAMLTKGTEDWKNKTKNIPLEDLKLDVHVCIEFYKENYFSNERFVRLHVKCSHMLSISKDSMYINDAYDE